MPKVLLSGNQSEIQKWNDEKSLKEQNYLGQIFLIMNKKVYFCTDLIKSNHK